MKRKKLIKDEKKKLKEHKTIEKFVKKKEKKKEKYLTKSDLKKKFKNSQLFINSEFVNDAGIIKLLDNSFAKVF